VSTVQEIKEAVASLTPNERSALARWLAHGSAEGERTAEAERGQRHADAVMSTFGVCRDESLGAIFEDIARQRHADRGREIPVP